MKLFLLCSPLAYPEWKVVPVVGAESSGSKAKSLFLNFSLTV